MGKGLNAQNHRRFLFRSNLDRGSLVVEVMVAIAILSVVITGHMSWVKATYDEMGNISQKQEIGKTLVRLKNAFGEDDVNCTLMLGGRSLNSPISEVPYYDLNGVKLAQPLLKVGEAIDGKGLVKTEEMQIKPISDLGSLDPTKPEPRSLLTDLEITFKKANGLDQLIRRVPLSVIMKDGKIVRCSASLISTLAINSRLCEVKYDGYNYYDVEMALSSTKAGSNCLERKQVVWQQGVTPFKATCSPGYHAAVSPYHMNNKALIVCRAQMSEGVALPPRTYLSGRTDSSDGNFARASFDESTSTCSFVFAATVDPSNFKSFIKCIP